MDHHMLNNLNIYYQNVRGLRTKSHSFLSNVVQSNYDIICLSETWLTPDFSDYEYFHVGYNVYRQDRGAGGERGGGVLIAVRRDLRARRRDQWRSARTSEELWVSIDLVMSRTCCADAPRGRPRPRLRMRNAFMQNFRRDASSETPYFPSTPPRLDGSLAPSKTEMLVWTAHDAFGKSWFRRPSRIPMRGMPAGAMQPI
ncbi:unnamed protein product [Leptosia nina]|uniref:Endonuclease/exonuclease/phosphatase domain-containing protein n=1 Tax=Leptosia nina TaxID=320188 RepID=A0AAV1J984_9NEOP